MFNLNIALCKVDTKVMERMRFLCSMSSMWQTPKSLMSHLDIFHVALVAWSVRFVVAFVSYSEMTESSELKEAVKADVSAWCKRVLETKSALQTIINMIWHSRQSTPESQNGKGHQSDEQ